MIAIAPGSRPFLGGSSCSLEGKYRGLLPQIPLKLL